MKLERLNDIIQRRYMSWIWPKKTEWKGMLTKRDSARLRGVDQRLVKVVRLAFEKWDHEFSSGTARLMVLEGLRTKERQAELYAQGRTAPGRVVTWTLNSKHITGQAVDLVPTQGKAVLWHDLVLFDRMKDCMFRSADELGVTIRWGADWDMDGEARERGETDSPHFELV